MLVSEFTDILQWWMAQSGDMTPTALAKKAGLDKTSVRQMIVHGRSPRIDTAKKICDVLGVSLDQFYAKDLDGKRRSLATLVDDLDSHEIELLLSAAQGLRERHRAGKK